MSATAAVGDVTVRYRVHVDFNGLGWEHKGRILAIVDFHKMKKGDLVRLYDAEGNEMDGTVLSVKPANYGTGWMVDVRADMDSWTDGNPL